MICVLTIISLTFLVMAQKINPVGKVLTSQSTPTIDGPLLTGSVTETDHDLKDPHPLSILSLHQSDKVSLYVKQVIGNNLKLIKEHNSKLNKPYKLKENRFVIYTKEQFQSLFLNMKVPDQSNYVSNHHQKQASKHLSSLVSTSGTRNLQEIKIDWKAANKMTSVKYQKQCGSCYSFTALSVIESAYIIQKSQYLNLAEQQVVDCSAPYGNYGCQGGWTPNVYIYAKDFGLAIEMDYPYTAKINSCTVDPKKPKFSIKNFVELKNDCSLVINALKNQPLSIAVNSDGWQYYSTGIYTDCRAGPSNHGVVLAGVDSTSWLIKNSWGYSWGEQGYIRVSRTAPNSACNVCKWASYPVL